MVFTYVQGEISEVYVVCLMKGKHFEPINLINRVENSMGRGANIARSTRNNTAN